MSTPYEPFKPPQMTSKSLHPLTDPVVRMTSWLDSRPALKTQAVEGLDSSVVLESIKCPFHVLCVDA